MTDTQDTAAADDAKKDETTTEVKTPDGVTTPEGDDKKADAEPDIERQLEQKMVKIISKMPEKT